MVASRLAQGRRNVVRVSRAVDVLDSPPPSGVSPLAAPWPRRNHFPIRVSKVVCSLMSSSASVRWHPFEWLFDSNSAQLYHPRAMGQRPALRLLFFLLTP